MPLPPPCTSFYAQTRAAQKVLVVDLGFLGDTVHLVPSLWELKRHYPGCALHVLTSTVGAEALRLAPCLDRAWGIELYPEKRTLGEQWQVLRALRRERFDVAYNFSGADRTILMTALTGARWKVGHEAGRRHWWNRWLIPNWVPRQSSELPVCEQRRAVLAACGFELAPARFDLRLPDEATAWAAANVPEGALHFSVSASTFRKEWPLGHWVELTRRLLRDDPQVRIMATGSAGERERARLQELTTAVANPGLQTFTGLSVARLGALLGRCAQHVGGDSGVLHLAAALGVPTVSIFRDYPGLHEWLPRGPQHRHLTAPCACPEELRDSCRARLTAECLERLTPEAVVSLLWTPATISSPARPVP
ncbi:MAG TPA: glycosyltransferase family 9 protein [Candidatus Acidoferrum sp.]|nr:glycosyltransferase family 9 protein [Candidatus Acidoferrum sp.]